MAKVVAFLPTTQLYINQSNVTKKALQRALAVIIAVGRQCGCVQGAPLEGKESFLLEKLQDGLLWEAVGSLRRAVGEPSPAD